jgi:hypothetical protein
MPRLGMPDAPSTVKRGILKAAQAWSWGAAKPRASLKTVLRDYSADADFFIRAIAAAMCFRALTGNLYFCVFAPSRLHCQSRITSHYGKHFQVFGKSQIEVVNICRRAYGLSLVEISWVDVHIFLRGHY